MYAQKEKPKDNHHRAAVNEVVQKHRNTKQMMKVMGNGFEAMDQPPLQKQFNNTQPVQMINLYRRGNRTPMNFTPRAPHDLHGNARGLSVNSHPGEGRQQVIDSTALVGLNAVETPTQAHPDHYSIRPNDETLAEWAGTRTALEGNNTWENADIHELTIAVNAARTGQQG